MDTSAACIEVQLYWTEYDNEAKFAALGAMDFEVFPAVQVVPGKVRKEKPYQ